MDKKEFYRRLRLEVNTLKEQFRNDNSAFLIWFLRDVFCIGEQSSVDSVCDGARDKGIDGIWVDDKSEDIYVFQSEFSPNNGRDSGDTKIREFAGVSTWFENETKVNQLTTALINLELKELLENLKIASKISRGYNVNYVYVTNKIFDQNGKEYLESSDIEAYDGEDLYTKYTYFSESDILNTPKLLSIPNTNSIQYNAVTENPAIILSIPAKELIKLDGIQDHTLFSRNVRLWSGKTRVNKGLAKTIENTAEHNKFFLYHNGVSIICSDFELKKTENKIKLEGYQVINGCQSLISFYQNRNSLTDDVSILVKLIKVKPQNPLIQKITQNANNQNAISLKDLKSNDRVQKGLQREFEEFFSNTVLYKIKKGESENGYSEKIELDFAGQLITAFYMEEPHKTHLKTNFYGDNYETLFSRDMNCKKIYLANLLYDIIDKNKNKIESPQIRGYGLAKFAILRILKSILEDDEQGKSIIDNPTEYINNVNIDTFKKAIEKLFKLVVLDINSYIEEQNTSCTLFDYKNWFKSKDFVDRMNLNILTNHKKTIVRHPEDSFSEIYKTIK